MRTAVDTADRPFCKCPELISMKSEQNLETPNKDTLRCGAIRLWLAVQTAYQLSFKTLIGIWIYILRCRGTLAVVCYEDAEINPGSQIYGIT